MFPSFAFLMLLFPSVTEGRRRLIAVGTGKWWEQGCGGNRSNYAWLFIISLNLGFGQFILLSLAWLLPAGSYLPLVPILRPGSYSQIYHLQGISTGIYVNVSISI